MTIVNGRAAEVGVSSRSKSSFSPAVLSDTNHAESCHGVTYSHQVELPRLPIPNLEDTLAKFCRVVAPLLDDKQNAETSASVAAFLKGEGPVLQQALVEYDKAGFECGRVGSYVEEFWNESYLAPDASVVLNLNPFFVLEDGPDPKYAKDQLHRAASLCFASIKFASLLKNETLSPDIFKGKPLCMDQFRVLFGSSRQPSGETSDDIHVYGDSTHVVVLCNKQFYYFPALWPGTGTVAVDESDILDILSAIRKHADQTSVEEASQTALGVFTSMKRSEWASARKELCEIEANAAALHVIDSALFVLVLDDFVNPDVDKVAANMLHGTNQLADGDTVQVGSCLNRWYDKLQIIVCRDGISGVNFEHSGIDGHSALRFVSDVFAETVICFAETIVDQIHGRGRIQHVIEAKVERAAVSRDAKGKPLLDVFPKKLVFDFSDNIFQRIYYAETALCDELTASDTCVLEFSDFGKLFIVGNNLSPDSFVQMAILIAYYKLYGKAVCMYEPVMTKSFYHGRTEAMRPVTPESKHLCEVWCKRESTNTKKLDALRLATIEHSRLVKESAEGKGVDRHLFSLKCMAERKGMPVPALFNSAAWKTLNHTILSTSNCGNPALRLFGFGPVVPDGFGVGYIIKDQALSFSVSTKHRQTQRYVRSIRTTLKEMQALLKPVTNVEVSQRPSLWEIRKSLDKKVSFGDFWGESSFQPTPLDDVAARPLPKTPHYSRRASGSKFFSQVKQQSFSSSDMMALVDSQISVDLDGTVVKAAAGGKR